jgi:hypothetical protein
MLQLELIYGKQNNMIIINKNSPHSIQNYLNLAERAGGDTVLLEVGTYKLTSDIFIPSGVSLRGISRDNCIIDCNEDYSIYIQGKHTYTDGTIAIVGGTTTITGTDTVFTEEMIGRYIWLNDYWYQIESIASETELEINEDYIGGDIVDNECLISDINIVGEVRNLTIINSNNSAIVIENTKEAQVYEISIYNSNIGIEVDNSIFTQIITSSVGNNIGCMIDNSVGFYINFSEFSFNGSGLEITNCYNATIFNTACDYNSDNGISFTDSSDIALVSNSFLYNGGNGVEMIDGNTDIQFSVSSVSYNDVDGIKLTTNNEKIIMSSCSVSNNGNYGVNITDDTNESNVLIGILATNNTEGGLNDEGTSTLKSAEANIL